ncbi:MAG: UTP--glucose-1-phosphate uridylyltransferase [Elusimicrobia bacterium]|nr:UTP--glucose-1-phosphate uridylyltransferase [Elusimicrobiota bacterium]
MNILQKYRYDEKLFEDLRKKFIEGTFSSKNNIIKDKISPPDETAFFNPKKDTAKKEKYAETGKETIKNGKLGVVIVNGGMATRFGGVVKGIVEVYDKKSFLQIKIEQIKKINRKYNVSIPVYFMNSFSTEKATIEYLEKNAYFGLKDSIKCFNQFIAKRLNIDGNFVMPEEDSYYGPGHGDFAPAFLQSGCLSDFIKNGGEHIWYSNVDNLGAVIDGIILGYHIEKKSEMTVELAEKYPGDKGGAPAKINNRTEIVEQFKFPADFNQDSISVFNTATYIFDADALNKNFNLPFYYVEKKVGDKKIVQFERLAGDLSLFLKTEYIIVDREERFFPIKTPQDLEKDREKLKKKFG